MKVAYTLRFYSPAWTALGDITQFSALDMSAVANGVGALSVTIPQDLLPVGYADIDSWVEVYREADAGSQLMFDTAWVLRRRTKRFEQGRRTLILQFEPAAALLGAEIAMAAPSSDQATKTAPADNMIKAIVREQFGADWITPGRLAVQADAGAAPTLYKTFARRNVLDLAREISQASWQAGTPLFFDVVRASPLELRTYISQRGADRTSGNALMVFGIERSNIDNVEYTEDHGDEANVIYAGGQGEDVARAIETATDATRATRSVYARRERWLDARHADTTQQLQDEADAALRAGRPRLTFDADIAIGEASQYGTHWSFGDKALVEWDGALFPVWINAVRITVRDGAETITARLRAEG